MNDLPELDTVPRSVISLVPSTTESLFALGLGESVIGVSDYCTRPAEHLTSVTRVGGPKSPNVAQIAALRPDLILANQEENSKPAIEQLRALGLTVWLTFPHTVEDALRDLNDLAGVFRSADALRRVQSLEQTLEWAFLAAQDAPPVRYFCPIWRDHTETGVPWWMTFNDDTYPADLLRRFGGINVFGARERRYPLLADLDLLPAQDPAGRDTRYPHVRRAELQAAQPELLLLPDEPYDWFAHPDDDMLQFAPRAAHLDGSLLFWPGVRLAEAATALPALLLPDQRSG